MKKNYLFILFVPLFSFLQAQEILETSLQQIHYGSSNAPIDQTKYKDNLIFSADDGKFGREPWIYNFTTKKSFMLKDIKPLYGGSISVPKFTLINNEVFFFAEENFSEPKLWKTDGTTGGTVKVSTTTFDYTSDIVSVATKAVFLDDNKIYASDGTAQGTTLLKEFSISVNKDFLHVFNDKAYFIANDGIHGSEIWQSDGTVAGTVLLKDIYPGEFGSVNELLIIKSDNTFYFRASDNGYTSLWKSDGTSAGTSKVKQINGMPSLLGESINGKIVFRAFGTNSEGMELWTSDGTENNTKILGNIAPGNQSLVGNDYGFYRLNNKIYFTGDINANGNYGRHIWETDGTLEGTKITNILENENDTYLKGLSSDKLHLVLSKLNNHNTRYISKGNNESTFKIENPQLFSMNNYQMNNLVDYNSKIIYVGVHQKYGNEFFNINPLNGEINLEHDMNTSLSAFISGGSFQQLDNKLVFAANDNQFGNRFYTYNSTNGINPLSNIQLSNINGKDALTKVDNKVYAKPNYDYAYAIARTDITPDSTEYIPLVTYTHLDSNSKFFDFSDSSLIFDASENGKRELFIIENSKNITEKISNFSVLEPYTLHLDDALAFDNHFYFKIFRNTSQELWKTNGTLAGTKKIIEYNPNTNPNFTKVLNNKMYFIKGTNQIWAFSTNSDVPNLIYSFEDEFPSTTYISKITEVHNNKLFFTAQGSFSNTGLYTLDTNHNVEKIKTSDFGIDNEFQKCGNFLYLLTKGQFSNSEYSLWRTNGTESGTIKLSTSPSTEKLTNFVCNRGYLYFTKPNTNKIYRTDGTSENFAELEIAVTDDAPLSLITSLYTDNDKLFLTGNNVKNGEELYLVTSTLPTTSLNTSNVNVSNKLGFLLFPNPAKDFIKVKIGESLTAGTFKVFEMGGNMVQTGVFRSGDQEINVSNLLKGTYILEITTKSGQKFSQKFIKK